MHQSHNIPWQTLASHCTTKRSQCSCGDPPCYFIELRPRELPRQQSDISHFGRCLIRGVREFAVTERRKYLEAFSEDTICNFAIPASFFKDYASQYTCSFDERILVDRCKLLEHPPIDSITQSTLSEWRAAIVTDWLSVAPQVTSLIKILLDVATSSPPNPGSSPAPSLSATTAFTSLLILAHHPTVRSLQTTGQSHAWGWDAASTAALDVYLFLNALEALSLTSPDSYARTSWYHFLFQWQLGSKDHNIQNLPHAAFFADSSLPSTSLTREDGLRRCPLAGLMSRHPDSRERVPDVFARGTEEARKEHLKKCWRLMVVGEVMRRECAKLRLEGEIGGWRKGMELETDLAELAGRGSLNFALDAEELRPREGMWKLNEGNGEGSRRMRLTVG
ncbi:MAG: hypothetical protein Q9160_006386 [Pyrenula sp. 1 TL-2023]